MRRVTNRQHGRESAIAPRQGVRFERAAQRSLCSEIAHPIGLLTPASSSPPSHASQLGYLGAVSDDSLPLVERLLADLVDRDERLRCALFPTDRLHRACTSSELVKYK